MVLNKLMAHINIYNDLVIVCFLSKKNYIPDKKKVIIKLYAKAIVKYIQDKTLGIDFTINNSCNIAYFLSLIFLPAISL